MTSASHSLSIKPLTGTIGAEIRGLDIARPLSAAERDFVFQAFLDHKVLVIRNQGHASPKQYAEFAGLFGELEVEEHPSHGHRDGSPAVKVLRSDAGNPEEDRDTSWHMDGSTRGDDVREWVSMLRAVEVPDYGRDTAFVDMEATFYRLSEPMQAFLSTLRATHSWGWVKPGAPTSEHDVAPIYERTGRRSLYVSPFYTTEIVGLRRDESELLLKFLLSKVNRLEHQFRIWWEPGTIGIWDNARTLHYPVMDRAFPRVMERIMCLLPKLGSSRSSEKSSQRAAA